MNQNCMLKVVMNYSSLLQQKVLEPLSLVAIKLVNKEFLSQIQWCD